MSGMRPWLKRGSVPVMRICSRSSSEQHSIGGRSDQQCARSVGSRFIAREDFVLSEDTTVILSAGTERFLGGGADISFGSVRLDRGEWDYRISASLETAVAEETTVGISAVALTPGGRTTEHAVGLLFNRRF